nr:uncharacterized protein LOC116155308 [Camelus dromedarius]
MDLQVLSIFLMLYPLSVACGRRHKSAPVCGSHFTFSKVSPLLSSLPHLCQGRWCACVCMCACVWRRGSCVPQNPVQTDPTAPPAPWGLKRPASQICHEMLCSLLFSLLSPGLEEHRPPRHRTLALLDSHLLPKVEPGVARNKRRSLSRWRRGIWFTSACSFCPQNKPIPLHPSQSGHWGSEANSHGQGGTARFVQMSPSLRPALPTLFRLQTALHPTPPATPLPQLGSVLSYSSCYHASNAPTYSAHALSSLLQNTPQGTGILACLVAWPVKALNTLFAGYLNAPKSQHSALTRAWGALRGPRSLSQCLNHERKLQDSHFCTQAQLSLVNFPSSCSEA